MISPSIERTVWGILRDAADRHEIIVHAIGGVDDHVHLAVSIPPKTSISKAVRNLKAASSTQINKRFDLDFTFSWQGDYGVHSFAERDLGTVQRNINDQRRHHCCGTVRDELEPAG